MWDSASDQEGWGLVAVPAKGFGAEFPAAFCCKPAASRAGGQFEQQRGYLKITIT